MGSTGAEKPPRKLRLRYPASCVTCGIALSQGAEAIWDPVAKTVTCLACAPARSLETGVAGASAAAEGERRADRRVERTSTGRVIAAVRSDQSLNDVPIFGALCFVESEWGLTDFPFNVGKAWVCFPGALRKALKKKGPLTRETMEHIARRLDLSLPPAVRT